MNTNKHELKNDALPFQFRVLEVQDRGKAQF
jgi:hypothetical protein